ncbi:hypothetical protein Cs7R123_06080 [Catellatospora sp. TT07R-123]|nr:hypothetical protein Cs7R123_06080 [Catellatospora sp. TT07R-123]
MDEGADIRRVQTMGAGKSCAEQVEVDRHGAKQVHQLHLRQLGGGWWAAAHRGTLSIIDYLVHRENITEAEDE